MVGKDGKLEKVKSVAIASVYTAPEKRGKGYARIMMGRLGEWLDQENVTFSVLFSDVGKV